nr:MAG TPA: hypothetical protein [Caudoviricetes sp.]
MYKFVISHNISPPRLIKFYLIGNLIVKATRNTRRCCLAFILYIIAQ